MNAGGVFKACKSNGILSARVKSSGKRVSNTLVTCLQDGDSLPKGELIPDGHEGSKDILM